MTFVDHACFYDRWKLQGQFNKMNWQEAWGAIEQLRDFARLQNRRAEQWRQPEPIHCRYKGKRRPYQRKEGRLYWRGSKDFHCAALLRSGILRRYPPRTDGTCYTGATATCETGPLAQVRNTRSKSLRALNVIARYCRQHGAKERSVKHAIATNIRPEVQP